MLEGGKVERRLGRKGVGFNILGLLASRRRVFGTMRVASCRTKAIQRRGKVMEVIRIAEPAPGLDHHRQSQLGTRSLPAFRQPPRGIIPGPGSGPAEPLHTDQRSTRAAAGHRLDRATGRSQHSGIKGANFQFSRGGMRNPVEHRATVAGGNIDRETPRRITDPGKAGQQGGEFDHRIDALAESTAGMRGAPLRLQTIFQASLACADHMPAACIARPALKHQHSTRTRWTASTGAIGKIGTDDLLGGIRGYQPGGRRESLRTDFLQHAQHQPDEGGATLVVDRSRPMDATRLLPPAEIVTDLLFGWKHGIEMRHQHHRRAVSATQEEMIAVGRNDRRDRFSNKAERLKAFRRQPAKLVHTLSVRRESVDLHHAPQPVEGFGQVPVGGCEIVKHAGIVAAPGAPPRTKHRIRVFAPPS